MAPNKIKDPDLLKLFSDLIKDETENEIFKILFFEEDEQKKLEKMISIFRKSNDQD